MVGEYNDLTRESKVDLSHLPPCQDSLFPHIYRVNHRVGFYKRANVLIFEKPKPNDENQGCSINENGNLEPICKTGAIVTESLINFLDATNDEKMEMEAKDYESDDQDKELFGMFLTHVSDHLSVLFQFA